MTSRPAGADDPGRANLLEIAVHAGGAGEDVEDARAEDSSLEPM